MHTIVAPQLTSNKYAKQPKCLQELFRAQLSPARGCLEAAIIVVNSSDKTSVAIRNKYSNDNNYDTHLLSK